MLSQKRRDQEFNHLVESDAADTFDLVTRSLLIFVSAIGLYFATGYSVLLVWGAGYALLDLSNMLLIRRTQTPVKPGRFRMLVGLSAMTVFWVGAMSIYLAFAAGGQHAFLAFCLWVGLALYCLTNHAAFSIASKIDLVGLATSGVGVTWAWVSAAETTSECVATAIAALAVFTYFGLCFRKTIGDRIELRKSLDARAHDQKLKSLGQLTSGVAHDFNNLLTVIGGNIELAMLDDSDPNRTMLMGEARQATDRGAALVSQLLAYTRKSSLNVQEVQSVDVMVRIGDIARRVVPADIAIEVNLEGDHALLKVDSGLLETAVLNLLINARDALAGRSGQIAVRSALSTGRDYLFISVEDNGPGMEEAMLTRATEPFFTTKGPRKGTGLGLSMVKGFAEQSGGRLELRNRLEGGLVASICLPARAFTELRVAI
ncbi:MAG: ATP-binding protein [Pseudomonadota bacterium]